MGRRKWTTPEEFDWLAERFPKWYRRHDKENKGFIKKTTGDFVKAFPGNKVPRSKLLHVSITFVSALT